MRGPIFKGWDVSDIQMDTRGAPRLYAAVGSYVYGATVQISDDLGETWRQIEHGPRFAEDAPGTLSAIWTVTPGAAATPDRVYAGVADAGLFVSEDRGEHWEEVTGVGNHPSRDEWMPGAGGMCCHSIIVDETNPDRAWIGISAVGVLRTDDGGKTWEPRTEGLPIVIEGKEHKNIGTCVHRLVRDPSNPQRLFQQNHQGVFVTNDGADTWERIENGLPSQFGFPMVIDPNHPDTVYIVLLESDEHRVAINGQLTVHRSEDAGRTWTPLTDGLPSEAYVGVMRQAMDTDTFDPCGVYFGTTNGKVYYSRNRGDSWQELPETLPRINSVSVAVLPDGA
jgi:photosystem II stability/assembly factor-like uncharacterized protein